eukprot:7379160-Prymnesium_polylepis.4
MSAPFRGNRTSEVRARIAGTLPVSRTSELERIRTTSFAAQSVQLHQIHKRANADYADAAHSTDNGTIIVRWRPDILSNPTPTIRMIAKATWFLRNVDPDALVFLFSNSSGARAATKVSVPSFLRSSLNRDETFTVMKRQCDMRHNLFFDGVWITTKGVIDRMTATWPSVDGFHQRVGICPQFVDVAKIVLLPETLDDIGLAIVRCASDDCSRQASNHGCRLRQDGKAASHWSWVPAGEC